MTPRPTRPGPSIITMLGRGVTMACPACGRRGLFRRWFSMKEDCPRCALHFERIEGHWIGAIGINTILSFGTLAVTLLTGLIVTRANSHLGALLVTGVAVSILAPTLFFPVSRTLWTAIDVAMRPLEPHEVDWSVVAGIDAGPGKTNPPHA